MEKTTFGKYHDDTCESSKVAMQALADELKLRRGKEACPDLLQATVYMLASMIEAFCHVHPETHFSELLVMTLPMLTCGARPEDKNFYKSLQSRFHEATSHEG